MPTPLPALIDALDAQRGALLDLLDGLEAEVLSARPGPEKWSILDIAEHLVVAERVVLRGLPPWADLADHPRSLKHRAIFVLVLGILRFGIPVKVPSRRMIPTGQATLPGLRREWDEHLRWLRSYAREFDADGRRRAVFLHPVAGPITLVQALRMNRLHLRTHLRQIRRRLAG